MLYPTFFHDTFERSELGVGVGVEFGVRVAILWEGSYSSKLKFWNPLGWKTASTSIRWYNKPTVEDHLTWCSVMKHDEGRAIIQSSRYLFFCTTSSIPEVAYLLNLWSSTSDVVQKNQISEGSRAYQEGCLLLLHDTIWVILHLWSSSWLCTWKECSLFGSLRSYRLHFCAVRCVQLRTHVIWKLFSTLLFSQKQSPLCCLTPNFPYQVSDTW